MDESSKDDLKTIVELLTGIASSLHQLNDSISARLLQQPSLESDQYVIAEPIRLVASNDSEGNFLCQIVEGAKVRFDWPVQPNKTQVITGLLRDLDLIRVKTSEGANPFSSPLFLTIQVSPSKIFRVNVGNASTVAARSLLAAIGNADRSIFEKPIKLTFSAGDNKHVCLVELSDYYGNSVPSTGASTKGLTSDRDRRLGFRSPEENAKIVSLITSAFNNFTGDPLAGRLGESIYWSAQSEAEDFDPLSINQSLASLGSLSEAQAYLGSVKAQHPDDEFVLNSLKALMACHAPRLRAAAADPSTEGD